MEGTQNAAEKIVVCGMSARLPESDNVEEFWEHLMNNDNMVTPGGRRWKQGQFGLPPNQGVLKTLSKFDAGFFGIIPRVAHQMDPQLRIIHEVAYEAVIDAGIHPSELKGTNTGVYVGCTFTDSTDAIGQETDPKDGYAITGTHRAVLSNRLSFHFDLSGPSYTVDTACSSSLTALHLAVQDIKNGQCSSAIVGACNITLKPQVALQFQRLNVLSKDGFCRPFDIEGDGFTRSEAVVVMYITKESFARRAYAYLVNTGTNSDGFKKEGFSYPSRHKQLELIQRLYREANIQPEEVEMIETHGTATKAGDKEEISAIAECLGQYRSKDNPLLIGSTKSNMGHAEGAAGLVSLVKVLLSFSKGVIPPNLNYTTPKPELEILKEGLLEVVSKPRQYKGGYVGISSFGFSGCNAHIVTKAFQSSESFPEITIPKLLIYEGRFPEAVEEKQTFMANRAENGAFYWLSNYVALGSSDGMSFRGYNIAGNPAEIKKVEGTRKRPIWFVFPGMGTQWTGMGKDLMDVDSFKKSILRCHKVLKNVDQDIDLLGMITNGSERIVTDQKMTFVAITSIQVALVNCLRDIGIIPEGIIGHSMGEIAAGYADGGLTEEEAVLSAYWRVQCVIDGNLPPGSMAAVGLSADELQVRLPPDVVIACHNSEDNVTISGDKESLMKFVNVLEKENVFVRKVETSDIAFHSHHMTRVGPHLQKALEKIIKNPIPRSPSWISSSVKESLWDSEVAKSCSPEYFAHNLVSPVLFHSALQKVPADALVVEIAPHCIMKSILKRSLSNEVECFDLMKRNETDGMKYFFNSIGKLYTAGINLNLNNMYPSLRYPVGAGTPPLSPSIKWDHSKDWHVPSWSDFLRSGSSIPSVKSFTIDISPEGPDNFVQDHRIDDRILYPATGFIVLVWKALAQMQNELHEQLSVKLLDVTFHQAVILSKSETVTLEVKILEASRIFEISEGTQLISSGKYILSEDTSFQTDWTSGTSGEESSSVKLEKADIYKELRLLGYNYGRNFQGISSVQRKGSVGYVQWNNNWVTFLDAMLQSIIICSDNFGKDLLLPKRIGSICINPKYHLNHIKKGMTRTTELPVHVDKTMTSGISGGVRIAGFHTTVAPSRRTEQNPTLEFVEFVPYGKFQVPLENSEIMEYTSVCEMYWNQVLKKFSNSYQGSPSMRYKYISNENEKLQLNEQLFLDGDEYSFLMLLRSIDKLSNTDDLAEKLGKIIDKHLSKMSKDKFLSGLLINAGLKMLLDVVWENSINRKLTVLELGGRYGGLFIHLVPALTSQPLLQLDLTVCDSDIEKLNSLYHDHLKSLNIKASRFDINTDKCEKFTNMNLVTVRGLSLQTKNVKLSLEKFFSMIVEGGFLLLYEITSAKNDFKGLREFISGIIEGNFLHPEHVPYLTSKQLSDIIQSVGFEVVQEVSDGICSSLFLCRKRRFSSYDQDLFVPISTQHFDWIEDLQCALQENKSGTRARRIWLTAISEYHNGVVGMLNCLRQEPGGEAIRCIFNTSFDEKHSNMTLDSATMEKLSEADLVMNVYRNGTWGSFRHQFLNKGMRSSNKPTAYLDIKSPGDLSSLIWVQLPDFTTLDLRQQVLCTTEYSSLNFRDVMLATGKLSFDAVEGANKSSFLGLEFSGFDPNGKRVMGISLSKAIATHISVKPNLIFDVPTSWTLEDAATVPCVYATVYYALIVRGQLRQGESILIHCGSGGVGQAAIAVAQSFGCRIFVTVGTLEKRKLLMTLFPSLTEDAFANSRDSSFEAHIMHQTKGEGVNLVLNSLAGEKLEAGVRCLSQGGRFLEIGKYDISINSNLGMSMFMRNVSFHGIALDQLLPKDNIEWTAVAELMKRGIKEGVVKPLTRCVFNREDAEKAFRYMAQGKHTGKVLIKMRQEEDQRKTSTLEQIYAAPTTTCSPDKVYLIVGGLGGFGLELSNWLIERGCMKLVLTGRSGIKSGYQAKYVHDWRKSGVLVKISKQDVGYEDEALQLLKQCLNLGPIGGIFNLALVLNDAEFENQTVSHFQEVCRPKLHATWFLDQASRQLCGSELDWFVVFSSFSSGRGNAEQTNYGFANSSMERICEKRKADGLPGLAIQWGVIGDVGRVFEAVQNNLATLGGTAAQSIQSCLSSMDVFLSQPYSVASSFIKYETDFKTQEDDLGTNLVQVVGKALGIDDVNSLDENSTLAEMGIDSLMVVEIRQILERKYSISVKPQQIRQLTWQNLKNGVLGNEDKKKKVIEKEAKTKETFVSSYLNLEETECLVELKAGNKEKIPVFIIHPGEGTIELYLPLTENTYDSPFYAFQVTKDVPHDSLQNMARFYLSKISSVYPKGPFHLAGYSLGAAVAIEITLQLQAGFEENLSVNKLVLIDGSHETLKHIMKRFIATEDPPDMQFLISYTQQYKDVTYEEMKKRLLRHSSYNSQLQETVSTLIEDFTHMTRANLTFSIDSMRKRMNIGQSYVPKAKLRGDVYLLKASESLYSRSPEYEKNLGLEKICVGNLFIRELEGGHHIIMQEPRITYTAEEMWNIFNS